MPRRLRAALCATVLTLSPLALTGCDRWSSKCDTDNTCKIKISGDQFHDFPRPYDTDHGLRSADRIRLMYAHAGGEARFQAGGVESTCTQGSSFQIVDTTTICDFVGDDSVELTTTRP